MGAATKIQGITVEIGGDTTKLGKAIGDANKQSADLQKELRGVNSLLKMDPSNVVLLQQKSDLLTESVSAARDKLKTLEAAQASVEAQFKAGTLGADQYRDFQREVEKTKADIKKYEQELADMDRTQDEAADSADDLGDATEEAGDKAEKSTQGWTVLKGVLTNLATDAIRMAADGLKDIISSGLEMASDLAEAENVVDTTFGNSAAAIYEFAQGAAEQFGISQLSAEKYAGSIGAALKGIGFDDDQIAEMSQQLTGLTGDLASFYNLESDESYGKIFSGVISGETEPLKSLGIVMSATNLQAYALSKGITKAYTSMSESEKAQLRYNYLLEQTADAQGDFAKTSDGYANQQRILKLNIENVSAAIGKKLLPSMTEGTTAINGMLDGSISMSEGISMISDAVDAVAQDLIDKVPMIVEAGLKLAFGLIDTFFDPDNIYKTTTKAIDLIFGLVDALDSAVAGEEGQSRLEQVGAAIAKAIWDSIKSHFARNYTKWHNSVMEEYGLNGLRVDGSHASGLSYVPYDGYIAELHRGERVLTASEADAYNALSAARGYDAPISVTSADVPYDRIIDSIVQLGADIKNMKLYLNGDKVVGGIQGPLDRAFGMQQMLNERGKL